jgi:hypothetical protein
MVPFSTHRNALMSEVAGMDGSPDGKYRPIVSEALGGTPVEMATLVPTPGLFKSESQEKLNITLHQVYYTQ